MGRLCLLCAQLGVGVGDLDTENLGPAGVSERVSKGPVSVEAIGEARRKVERASTVTALRRNAAATNWAECVSPLETTT